MPNRILKESVKRSDQIDQLNWFEEVVYYRLILTADDYGCADGRMVVLKNDLFPTKEKVSKASVSNAIRKLVQVGLVARYEVDGMPYLYFPTWEKHQRVRNKHRKYPQPPDGDLTANCCQMPANGQPESESESEIESESNPKQKRARAAAGDDRPDFNTVEVYAANNLAYLSPGNMEEMAAFKQELPEELIRHAIDTACANGKASFAYARAIMARYRDSGFKSIGDVKAAEEKRAAEKGTAASYAGKKQSASNFKERTYTEEESQKDYFDLQKWIEEMEHGGEPAV